MALVGLWRLDASGEEQDAVLRIGDRLSLWRKCGMVSGEWRADQHGGFLGDTTGYSGDCAAGSSGPLEAPAWLRSAVAYRAEGADRTLIDAAGKVVATLRPGAQLRANPNVAADLSQPPGAEELARVKARLKPAVPLPAGQEAATPTTIAGTWHAQKPAPGKAPKRPSVTLDADGDWHGTDGCNGSRGRWLVGPAGSVLGTAGASTLMACEGMDNTPIGLVGARRAGFDGPALVAFDADGKEIARLIRG
jgi:hypothetical protein